MNRESSAHPTPTRHLLAVVMAWVMPGLGHILIGERDRGLIIAASIGIIWLSGLLIGGIGVIDHRQQPFWFAGQMLLAPSVPVDIGTQKLKQMQSHALAMGRAPLFEPSFGRVNEQGVLFTALAGLLNLLAITDVVCRMSDTWAARPMPSWTRS